MRAGTLTGRRMSATHLLINLIGEIALLLWGIHMVQSGVTRVFGTDLRRMLGRGLSTRFRAFLAGLGVTAAAAILDGDRADGDVASPAPARSSSSRRSPSCSAPMSAPR